MAHTPKYRRHSTRDVGFSEFRKKRYYFSGKYNSSKSLTEYARFLEMVVEPARETGETDVRVTQGDDVPIALLCASFLDWAKNRYRKNGRSTGTYERFRDCVVPPLVSLYGSTPTSQFGPVALKKTRQKFVEFGLCRNEINDRTSRIKRIFSWGVENELVSKSVAGSLRYVSGLIPGETMARETMPVPPSLFGQRETERQIRRHMFRSRRRGHRGGACTSSRSPSFRKRDTDPRSVRRIEEYVSTIKKVVEDYVIDPFELSQVKKQRVRMGVSPEQVRSAHAKVFASLIAEFADDNFLDDEEDRSSSSRVMILALIRSTSVSSRFRYFSAASLSFIFVETVRIRPSSSVYFTTQYSVSIRTHGEPSFRLEIFPVFVFPSFVFHVTFSQKTDAPSGTGTEYDDR